MENGWQTKYGVKSPCSSSGVTSSSDQIQLQDVRSQIYMNMSHCIPPHDAREQGPLSPRMKQAPTSRILNFSSCKPIHPESGSSFQTLLSGPPSILQYDFQQQLTVRPFSSSCVSDTSALSNVGSVPNWPLLQNRSNFNARSGVDVRPMFQSVPITNANSSNGCGRSDDLDTLRAFISQAGSRNESGIDTSLKRGVNCASSSSSTYLDACPPPSVTKKQSAVASGCPRVFCMGASGDLLLSSTGLFGILCSCHGVHMSVSNFCEHSGLSDVNPGYAVRIDSGESIAQWRKAYLQKFGIRAPGDHRGWDWPEGLLATSGLANSSMAVADRRKVFDLSSLFTSSAESSTQLGKNVSTSQPRPTKAYSNQGAPNAQLEKYASDHCNMGSFGRNLHNTTDNPEIACPTLRSFRPPPNEGSGNDCQMRSFHYMPSQENSFGSAFQNLHGAGSKANDNLKDDILQRGTIPSSIELKLGQPCQRSWGSGSAALSALRPHSSDFQTTTAMDKLNCNVENPKVTEGKKQHIFGNTPSVYSRTKESFEVVPLKNAQTSFQAGPQNNALTSAHGATFVEQLKDGLHNSFAKSVFIPPSDTTAGGISYQKESKRTTDSHSFSGWMLHHQHHLDRSVLIDFSCNGDAPIRPLDVNGSLNKKSKTMDATGGHKDSYIGSELSSKIYAAQMESSGFTRTGRTCNPSSSALPAAQSTPLGIINMLGASNYSGNGCSMASNLDRDQFSDKLKHSLFSFRTTPTMQATSTGFSPISAVLTPGHASASFSNNIEPVSSPASDESERLLALRTGDKLCDEKINDSPVLNQRSRVQTEQIQQSKNRAISDLRAQGLILEQGPFEGQKHRHSYSGQNISSSFLPAANHEKGMNLGAISEEMTLRSKLIDTYNEDSSNPQPKQQSTLACGRQESMGCGCKMVQRSASHISDRCNCKVQILRSKREQDCNGSSFMCGSKEQSNVAVLESSMYNSSRFSNNVSIGKPIPEECSHKGTIHHLKGDCGNSQWIDVPSRANAISKLRCPNATTHITDTREEPKDNLREHSTKGTPKKNQPTEFLKGKEISDISSECSAPAVTQASNEVDMTDSVTIDASHTICDGSQLADQGSAISRSCSSVEGIDSVRNLTPIHDDKTRSTEEEPSTLLENVAHHSVINEYKQTYPKSNGSQNFAVSGGSSGEEFNKTEPEPEPEPEPESGFKSKKRKRTTRWKTLGTPFTIPEISSLPSESRICGGSASKHHAPNEDIQVLHQSNLNLSKFLDVDSNFSSIKRRRSSLYSVKTSCNRYKNGVDDIVEADSGDLVPLNSNDDSIDMPEHAAVRKLRQAKPPEAVKRQVKATEAPKGYWLKNSNPDGTLKCWSKGFKKMKPVACGKYGIICSQELDIDQLKPPKIVPLSQVLKASKRQAKFEKKNSTSSRRKKKTISYGGGTKRLNVSSSSHQSQVKRHNKVLLCHNRLIDAPTKKTQPMIMDETHSDDPDVPVEDEADEDERNLGALTSHRTVLSKIKDTRVRSLYELSLGGNELIPADISRSQHVPGTHQTVCGLKNIAPKNSGISEGGESRDARIRSCRKLQSSLTSETDELCCVCGISNKDSANCLLECGNCLIRIHQACYGITRVPKGDWYCRPCRTSSKDVACVLCGYGEGAMTRAFGSRNVVKSLLRAWDIRTEPNIMSVGSAEALYVPAKIESQNCFESSDFQFCPPIKPVVHNSIVSGLFDPTVKQWVHMVCGLWTPGTRCPNVDTMSAFDVSGVSHLNAHMVCYICNRIGGSCIRCRVETCYTHFHPWCAHHKGLLQSEVEGVDNNEVGFYGRCLLHANSQASHSENDRDTDLVHTETEQDGEPTCARTEVYLGKKQRYRDHYSSYQGSSKGGCLVTQVQLDAWLYINRHKLRWNKLPKSPVSDVDHDYRKEYARYKQAKGWKHLVVYKSGIHALGLYTSQFLQRGAMVVEYVGEIVGHRVADKRESEYLTGRKLQYKSACYFFRIDKEQIIDATCKGGIARFVNHSCQPNCVAKVLTFRGNKKVVFFAQRDIYPGEEVTYDYHFNHEDEGKKIPCFCNSKNCRRYLN